LSTSAHLYDRSAHFGLQPPPDGLSDWKAWQSTSSDSDWGMPRPRSPLFSDWHDQSRLGPTDRGRPLGRDQETCGEKQGKAHTSKHNTMDRTLSPAGIVLCNCPDTNSIVGADIFLYSIVGAVKRPYGKPPHMPLGIDSVVGARIHRTG
jgi:hypothetical protein